MSTSTPAAGTIRHPLSGVLLTAPPTSADSTPAEHTAWMADYAAETFGHRLHRTDRAGLVERLWRAEEAVWTVADDLSEALAALSPAEDSAGSVPTHERARRDCALLLVALQLLRSLLVLLRRLVTARSGGNPAAAAHALAAGRVRDGEIRAALVGLALTAHVLVVHGPEHLAALLIAALLLLARADTLAAPLRAEDWPPSPDAALRRVLPTRAPPVVLAVTATA